jgi:hypothetical protein
LKHAAAGEAAERQGEAVARIQAEHESHQSSRPPVPRVLNRVASHRAFRIAIAVMCVAIEMLITAPALQIVSHGKVILGARLEDLLALALGVATFMTAEVAAECFITWLHGRRVQRTHSPRRGRLPDWRWLPRRRSGRPRARTRTGRLERAAGLASLAIVLTMVGLLGWFISVRDENQRAAAAAEQGAAGTPAVVLPGLPAAPAATRSGAGPIAGLPGGGSPAPSGPIGFSGAGGPTTRGGSKVDTEGKLGPVGALSIVAFLVAFTAAALAGATEKYTAWRRRRRRLIKRLVEARKAQEAAQRAAAGAGVQTPGASLEYDSASRIVVNLVERNLGRVQGWEARVRELYVVFCQRQRVEPVPLGFPPLPEPRDEVRRLLEPSLPHAQQAGATGYGMIALDPDAPAAAATATPLETPAPAADTEPEAADEELNGHDPEPEPEADPPPARAHPDDVLDDLGALIGRLRDPGSENPTRNRRGRSWPRTRDGRRRRFGRARSEDRQPS